MIAKNKLQVLGERHRILLKTDDFICLLPHPDLREYISNYNITFPTKDLMPDSFTEMPSGCAALTIGNDRKQLFVNLDGPATKPCTVGSQANSLELMVTIEFKPAGFYALTGISQYELIDQSIAFDAVIPRLNNLLSDMVEKADSVSELLNSLDRLLLEHLRTAYHPQFMQTLQTIVGSGGTIDVRSLSHDIHYSERQLNRIFKQHVGISTKSFSRLIRINNTFGLLNKPDASLTLVSDIMGFHDLSHFIRSFKLVCGISPQEYCKNMSDFYINPMKF